MLLKKKCKRPERIWIVTPYHAGANVKMFAPTFFVGLLQNRCLKNRSKEKVSENRRCGGSHSLFSYTNVSFGPENRILQQALYRFGVSNTRGKVNLRLPGRQQLLPVVGTAVAAVKACADLLCPAPEPLGQGNTVIHAVFRAVCEAGNRGELDFRM